MDLMDNNWRPTQGGGEPAMDAGGDWRSQLHADSRQRIVNKIMDTLKRHLPFSGQEGLQEIEKIAVRFEEKIYTAATNQSEYLRKISLKMQTMQTKIPMPNALQSNSANNGQNSPDPDDTGEHNTAMTTTAAGSAKWTDELHTLFVELCACEIEKGNKYGTSLSKVGWATVRKEMIKQNNVNYTLRQLKYHWYAMKRDYQLFKQLKFGESGLRWNEVTKTIDASPLWWSQKTQENSKFGKFKNKDLSLYMQYYQTLFGDIVTNESRAKTANTYSAVHLQLGEAFTGEEDDGKEDNSDRDDNNVESAPNLFPSSLFKFGKSSGSKRKKSGAEFVRECLDGLVDAMSCTTEEANLNAAVDLLDSMDEIPCGSDLYYFARRYILDKGNRTLFLKACNNAIRYGEIMYNFKASGNQSRW